MNGIRVEFLEYSQKNLWNEFVERNPSTIAWHRWEWSDAVRDCYRNTTFHPMAVFDDGRIEGILPLYIWKEGAKREAVSVPYAVAGGITAENSEVAGALLGKAIDFTVTRGLGRLVLKHYKTRIEGDLSTDDNYHNRELGLTPDTDELLRKISPENAERIEESHELGLRFEIPSEDLSGFYDLLLKFHHANGIPCAGRRWIASLLRFGMYSVAVARDRGKIIAATMVKEFRKTVSFPYSCTIPGIRRSELAMYGLYWHLIEKYAVDGFEIFHSGRMPNSGEASAFRKGWGGVEHPYYYQFYPMTVTATEFRTRRGWKRNLFSTLWKSVPSPLVRIAGPAVVRRFP